MTQIEQVIEVVRGYEARTGERVRVFRISGRRQYARLVFASWGTLVLDAKKTIGRADREADGASWRKPSAEQREEIFASIATVGESAAA